MYYFGDRSCPNCPETKRILEEAGIWYEQHIQFIDVEGAPEWKNHTPTLQLDDGTMIEGKDNILRYFGLL